MHKFNLFLGMALLGAAGLLMKPLAGRLGPIEIGIARGFIAVAAVLIIRACERRLNHKPQFPLPIDFSPWQLFGSFCIGLNAIVFSVAIVYTTTSNAVLIAGSTPVYMVGYTMIFNRKVPSGKELGTAAIVLCGMLLFFREGLRGQGFGGMLAAVFAGITFAGYIFSQGKIGKAVNSIGEPFTRGTVLLGYSLSVPIGLICLAIMIPTGSAASLWQPLAWPTAGEWVLLVLIGALQTGLAGWLWSSALPRVPPLLSALAPTLGAIYAPLLTLIAYGEPWPGQIEAVGVVLVHLGVLWAALSKVPAPNRDEKPQT